MKKSFSSFSAFLLVLTCFIGLFAEQTKDPYRVGGLTLKPGACTDSVSDTLTGERNLYLDYTAKNTDGTVNAVVEIPAGTHDKWETDVKNGRLFRECKNGAPRVIKYLGYPANYGMIPRTLGGDGDPLDVIVLGGMMRRGAAGAVKPIGVFFLNDNGSIDDKILAVMPGSFLGPINSIAELSSLYPGYLDIIETWFTNYKGVGGGLESKGFGSVDTAIKIIDAAIKTTDAQAYAASYNERPDDSLTVDGFTRTYGKYGASLSGVLGDDDTLSNGKNMYQDYKARNSDKTVNAVIEIPAGTNAKWETDVNTGKFFWENRLGIPRVVRFLGYPGNYGMIPRTKGGDGDPLDVVIIGSNELRGEVVAIKIIGVMFLVDGGLLDDKLIAVIPGQPMSEVNTLSELKAGYPGVVSIIETWFTNYKGIGGGLVSKGFGEADTAKVILFKSITDFGDPVKRNVMPNAGGSIFMSIQTTPSGERITAAFSLAHSERVQLTMYSLSGEKQTVLADENFSSGAHRISWDAHRIQPGCYALKMQAGNQVQMKSMQILK